MYKSSEEFIPMTSTNAIFEIDEHRTQREDAKAMFHWCIDHEDQFLCLDDDEPKELVF